MRIDLAVLSRWAAAAAATLSPPAFALDVDCFAVNEDRIVFVRVEKVDVLVEPKPEAASVASLSLGNATCALTSKGDGEAEWVMVQDARPFWMKSSIEPARGWVPRSAVAYTKDLRRLTRVRAQKVIVDVGDYHAEFDVHDGGTFSVAQVIGEHRCRKKEIPNEYGACEDWGVVRGEFMGIGILAIPVSKQKYSSGDGFKLRSDGVLCAWQNGSPPEQCR